MCIIIVKPIGKTIPEEHLFSSFVYNSDGAGYVFNKDGKNILKKGFMTWEDFIKNYKNDIKGKYPAIIHFRLATSGQVVPELTHPFPITEDTKLMKKTFLISNTLSFFAHNGAFHHLEKLAEKKDISDTMVFGKKVLTKNFVMENIEDEVLQEMLKEYIGSSKLAIMKPDGKIITIGEFIEVDGVLYSNSSFRPVYDLEYPWKNTKTCSVCGSFSRVKFRDDIGDFFCSSCYKNFRNGNKEILYCDYCGKPGFEDNIKYDEESESFICQECKRWFYDEPV